MTLVYIICFPYYLRGGNFDDDDDDGLFFSPFASLRVFTLVVPSRTSTRPLLALEKRYVANQVRLSSFTWGRIWARTWTCGGGHRYGRSRCRGYLRRSHVIVIASSITGVICCDMMLIWIGWWRIPRITVGIALVPQLRCLRWKNEPAYKGFMLVMTIIWRRERRWLIQRWLDYPCWWKVRLTLRRRWCRKRCSYFGFNHCCTTRLVFIGARW